MSVSVTIRTMKHLAANAILNRLVGNGEQITATSDEFPCATFGTIQKAISGVKINREDNGYEVSVNYFASADDFRLFAITINTIMEMTGGKAYLEDDDNEEVTDPITAYDKAWAEEQQASGFHVLRTMIAHGHDLTLLGLFNEICIGPKMLDGFGIPLDGDCSKDKLDELFNFFCTIQWYCVNHESTRTRLQLKAPEGSDKGDLSISAITIDKGEVTDFDYVSDADVLAIIDMDDNSNAPVFIPFSEAWKVLSDKYFNIMDERQFIRTKEPLTVEEVHEMMEFARQLQPDDLHHSPSYPGEGYDERQHTFILMWNPDISSVTLADHQKTVSRMLTEYFNWSVWEYDKARCDDRFYLVRVGKSGHTGIVMSGVFDSQPYEAEDWSGHGRRTFYMDMLPNVVLDPERAPMLTTETLAKAIPTFDWSGGHSGRLLTAGEARALETLWRKYLDDNEKNVDGTTLNVNWHHTYERH